MAILETSRADPAERARAAILAEVVESRARLRNSCINAVRGLAEMGDWKGVIETAVTDAGFSEAEVARRLEVMRSTVNRWLKGQTRPPQESILPFADLLCRMIEGDGVVRDQRVLGAVD